MLQDGRPGWREDQYDGGNGGEDVSFVVNVHEPFEIYPGMECRAMVGFKQPTAIGASNPAPAYFLSRMNAILHNPHPIFWDDFS